MLCARKISADFKGAAMLTLVSAGTRCLRRNARIARAGCGEDILFIFGEGWSAISCRGEILGVGIGEGT